MTASICPARPAAILLAVLLLAGCELALHEVQQPTGDDCGLWRTGCPAVIDYGEPDLGHPRQADLDPFELYRTVVSAVDAPYRPCNGIGLACQARIIGDVLWDEYFMVLSDRSNATSTTASGQRPAPAPEARPGAPAAATVPSQVLPAPEQGRIVRTQGSRAGELASPATMSLPR